MELGNFQPMERAVAFSMDKLVLTPSGEPASLHDFATSDEWIGRSKLKPAGCSLHGLRSLKIRPDGSVWCNRCNAERLALRRRLNQVPEWHESDQARTPDGRWKRTCSHPEARRVTSAGQPYCLECAKVSRERNIEKRREYDRIRAKDPARRKALNEASRRYREKVKARAQSSG